MTKKEDNTIWWIVGFVFVLCYLVGSCKEQPNTPSTSSGEYKQVYNRMRQEGYNPSDADKAAKAVIKFHEKQGSK